MKQHSVSFGTHPQNEYLTHPFVCFLFSSAFFMCYFNIWILTVGFLWPPSESLHADNNRRCRDKKKKTNKNNLYIVKSTLLLIFGCGFFCRSQPFDKNKERSMSYLWRCGSRRLMLMLSNAFLCESGHNHVEKILL